MNTQKLYDALGEAFKLGREFEAADFPQCMQYGQEFDNLVEKLCEENK